MDRLSSIAHRIARTQRTARGTVSEMTALLEKYQGTAEFLEDLALAQYTLVGLDPDGPDKSDDMYPDAKKFADLINGFAAQIRPLEEATW
jgi:hypothetical protein